ncbi:tetraacyldisaccharide 4'-kinase [Flavobacterium noncentrifugens]|uniref:Tetraacyldisaccharide 4'-kinase n=1 Tax=Flavobacterium noncentrifugens TaxID=1128970 RepID=A0A1G8VEF9_9FLAO|nr:tetraacyldisaccharide 4'-kinase [Flavobacterium noncentrifugens]GEP50471.1 tetraacyldisaccharide 4'-kinase [Flavobacterium noncentrifugens]SDJ64482.1 lipid-A-disaccharide kinase [Flavobacterium noncentrifugens]
MNFLRKILFPFAVLYGFVTQGRNFLFDIGILKSHAFKIPVIAVGNLSVGGTGKTPQIEYLIRLLAPKYKIATLSRGYKRKSKGFILADANASAEILGDEPFQFYQKFPQINVAVDADRKNGIEQLLVQSKPEIILLDDAFQHRKVNAGFYILLTAYGDLYADDWMLPTGNLRESRSGAIRANVIIVTKCPPNLSEAEQDVIWKRIDPNFNQQLFFTYIDYDHQVFSKDLVLDVVQIKNTKKVLLAGIAKPQPFFDYLKNENDVILEFPDHHDFSDADIASIRNKADGKIVVTTEKDYVRLKGKIDDRQLFYLPIQSKFISESQSFDKTLLKYTEKTKDESRSAKL